MLVARQRALWARVCNALICDGNVLLNSAHPLYSLSTIATESAISAPTAATQTLACQLIQFRQYAKQKGNKKGGGKEPPPPTTKTKTAADTAPATEFKIKTYEDGMQRAIDHLQHELANIRTGRATPGMLDHLKVEVYGEKLPIKAVGTVSVRDPQLLAVTVFDPSTVDAIASGITSSPLKLNPRVEGHEVLVPIPKPTSETMAAMAKLCKAEGEDAKVTVRHVRKQAMESTVGLASEDEQRRAEKEVQTLTDKFVSTVESLVASKQKDILGHNN